MNCPENPKHLNVPKGFGGVAPGCSDTEVAALALAKMEQIAAEPLIEAIRPTTPMLEVSLALFGHVERLKPEHFASKSRNQQLQLAAVDAVIRSRGIGLQLAINYRQATHWWEEERVAKKICLMLQTQKAPGSEKLTDCKDLKTLQEWFAEHGSEYLQDVEQSP